MNTGSEDRVLVVEEPDGRETLKLGLEMAGYRVDLADDGEAGLLVAAARTPAVAIIDLKVPIIDGWSLAEALRCMLGKAITSRRRNESRRARRARAEPDRGIR